MTFVSSVFSKEMVIIARKKGYYIARAVFLGLLLFVVVLSSSSSIRSFQYSGFVDTSYLGRKLFQMFTITQLVSVLLLVPAMTAPVVASEKDRNTLGLLLMSNLRPRNILLDKLLSRIVLITLILFSSLPLFFVLLVFGGVSPLDILYAYAAILGTILFCCGIGLLCSTLMNTMHSAMIVSYISLVIYIFFVIFLEEEAGFSVAEIMIPLDCLDGRYDFHSLIFLFISAMFFVLSLLICIRKLPKMAGRKKRHAVKRLSDYASNFFERINFTGVTLMDESKSLKNNAILWKETHKNFFASNTFIIRASYMALIVSMLLMTLMMMWKSVVYIIISVCAIALVVIALVSSSTAFTSEREKRSFEVLMSTPLTARSIVLAKFIGIMKQVLPIILMLLLWAAIVYFSEDLVSRNIKKYRASAINTIINFSILAFSQLPMIVVIGLNSSVRRKKTATAILETFLITATWCLLPLVMVLLEESHIMRFKNNTEELILSMTPFGGFVMILCNDFWAWSGAFWSLCWMFCLYLLIENFDRLIGRQ